MLQFFFSNAVSYSSPFDKSFLAMLLKFCLQLNQTKLNKTKTLRFKIVFERLKFIDLPENFR